MSKQGMSANKKNELKYFCMQYQEKVKEARYSDLRKKDVEQIEQSAIQANADIYQYILKNVTQGIPYEYMDVPCGRRQFYESRQAFYAILAEKR